MSFLDEGGAGDQSRLDRLFNDLARERHGFTRGRDGFGADKRIEADALSLARKIETADPGRAARMYGQKRDALLGAKGQADQDRLRVETGVWRTVKNESGAAVRTAKMDRPYVRAARRLASGITARMKGEYSIAKLNPADRAVVALAVVGRGRFSDVEPKLRDLAIAERAVESETLAMVPATIGRGGVKTYSTDQIRRQDELRRSLQPHIDRAQSALEGAVASDAGGDDWTPLAGPLANGGHGDGLVPQSDGRVLVDDGTPQTVGA